MRITYFLHFLLLVVLSCNTGDASRVTEKYVNLNMYPFEGYSSVELLVLNSGGAKISQSKIEIISGLAQYPSLNAGLFFIDTFNVPLTRSFSKYILDSSKILHLQEFLFETPCYESSVIDKGCFPVYDRVLVFKDNSNKVVAQWHISTDCEMTALYPASIRMCNRDNQIDFLRLDSLLNSVYSK